MRRTDPRIRAGTGGRARPTRGGMLAAASAVAALLGLSACVSSVPSPVSAADPHGSSRQLASPTPAAAAAQQSATAPLTGLPVSQQVASRPAVALVIAGSRPLGLAFADVVFEEITTPTRRYIAVFQSRQAGRIGPITSTRPTDGMALSVLHPLFGYDGGTTGFVQLLRQSKVIDFSSAGHHALYRNGAGGPTTSTEAFWAAARRGTSAPPALYQYRGGGPDGLRQLATVGVRRVSQVRVTMPGGGTQTWQFDAKTDRWNQAGGGPRVAVSNLIIQIVKYKQVYLSRRYGITAGSARVIGTGHALVVTGIAGTSATGRAGLAAWGSWRKSGLATLTDYLDDQDLPMSLQPGPTWVILAPKGTEVRTA